MNAIRSRMMDVARRYPGSAQSSINITFALLCAARRSRRRTPMKSTRYYYIVTT